MEWTFARPTQPGAYFYRIGPKENLAVVSNKGNHGDLRVNLTGTYMEYSPRDLTGEWAGPIPRPEEKR